jgi:3-oxoacyl-[acyl-carrier-protein] synthase III
MHDALEAGKIKRDDIVVLCASGGGLNMACLAMRY